MTEKPQTKVTFNEDADIIMRLDEIAENEGTSRGALIRRAIRQMFIFSPKLPTFGNTPETTEAINA